MLRSIRIKTSWLDDRYRDFETCFGRNSYDEVWDDGIYDPKITNQNLIGLIYFPTAFPDSPLSFHIKELKGRYLTKKGAEKLKYVVHTAIYPAQWDSISFILQLLGVAFSPPFVCTLLCLLMRRYHCFLLFLVNFLWTRYFISFDNLLSLTQYAPLENTLKPALGSKL